MKISLSILKYIQVVSFVYSLYRWFDHAAFSEVRNGLLANIMIYVVLDLAIRKLKKMKEKRKAKKNN